MKHANLLRTLLLALAVALGSLGANAQSSRAYIRECIQKWGECRNVAITRTNGDLALYGHNGSARSGCPKALNDELERLNAKKEYIHDVQLTEQGRFVILYGDNGLRWNGIPSSLESKLREYNSKQEVITSVTFNDGGEWVVITENYFSSSGTNILEWLKAGIDDYGKLWTACITDDSLVAVYERGYKFYGDVPQDLQNALRATKLNVVRLKIAGSAWFFADANGRYQYNM